MSTMNSKILLSGEQLVQAHAKTNHELPPAGCKEFQPTDSWLEKKQIQCALDQRKALLEEERVEKRSSLMGAEWVAEKHKAKVSQKNKHWESYGHHSDNADWLFPEETLFLIEMNCLECVFGGVPLSIQKGYSVLLQPENGCSLNEYKVFAHLSRLGYRVVRHLPELTVTAYEKKIRLDLHLEQKTTYDETRIEPDVDQSNSAHPEHEKTDDGTRIPGPCALIVAHDRQDGTRIPEPSALIVANDRQVDNEKTSHETGSPEPAIEKLDSTPSSSSQITRLFDFPSSTSPEVEVARPDLPPKKIVDLPLHAEITIESRGSPISSSKDISKEVDSTTNKSAEESIEFIDIADSSDESSEESSSDESAIEIIGEFPPNSNNHNVLGNIVVDDDDDCEIIEVPVKKKEIIVATIESSDSENEKDEEISDSESDKSYDGNWKRKQTKKKKRSFVRPPTMSKLPFLAVDEFCVEKPLLSGKPQDITQSVNVTDSETEKSNRDVDESALEDFLCLEPSPVERSRPIYIVKKTRNEILDLMPTMAEHKSKIMSLDSPDLRLIPDRIVPKQQSYTFNIQALRARFFSYRSNFRGRRFFHGPRFNNYGPYFNNTNNMFFNQPRFGSPLLPTPPLSQMFGSDIHSVARGMMQFASSLLLGMPQSNQSNGLMQYNPPQTAPFISALTAQSFPLNSFNTRPTYDDSRGNFASPNHIRFSDSSPNVTTNDSFQPSFPSYGSDRSRNSRYSGADSEFDSSERTFTPPTVRGSRNNYSSRFNRPRGRQNSRSPFSPCNPQVAVDPAYVKPDIPISDEPIITGESGEFIPFSSNGQNHVEIVEIPDNDDEFPRRPISSRFQRKRKRKGKNQRAKMPRNQFQNNNSAGRKTPSFVFLDYSVTSSSVSDSASVKEENNEPLIENVKTESSTIESICKQEVSDISSEVSVKSEATEEVRVKNEDDNEVRVKLEQEKSDTNVRVEIKIESSSDTSSVTSLPIATLVTVEPNVYFKQEPDTLNEEALLNVKIENEESIVKIENCIEENKNSHNASAANESVERDVNMSVVEKVSEETHEMEVDEVNVPENSQSQSSGVTNIENRMESDNGVSSEIPPTVHNPNHPESSDANSMEVEAGNDISLANAPRTESSSTSEITSTISCWAEVKKHNIPITSAQENQNEEGNDGTDDDDDEGERDEVRPLIRPKDCKTIGTVLSALQIFSPFSPQVPEDILKLKITFDMYLPSDFRKSQRGLPQYRIAVFGGSEPLPSPAQLYELRHRFQDSVPVLQAIVMPGSVVFYSCADISLPVDITSYKQ